MSPKCHRARKVPWKAPTTSYRELTAFSGGGGFLFAPINAFVVKVIIAGATGLIGSEVLDQLIQNETITEILVLSRRPLKEIEARDSRIRVFVLQSFEEYDEDVARELVGAKAVFWCIGGNPARTPSNLIDEVEVRYPLALAKVLTSSGHLVKEKNNDSPRLRFLFISGTNSERDQSKHLWFLEQGRKARGLAENRLLELAEQNSEEFEAVVIKPAYVVCKESVVPDIVVGLSRNAIRVDELAVAMMNCALDRHGSETVENAELRSIGKKLLIPEKKGSCFLN